MSVTSDYVWALNIGCDVDWCKTNPGRKAYHQSRGNGISVPKMFHDRGFDHVRIRVKDYDLVTINPATGLTLLDEIAIVVEDCVLANLTPIVAFQGERFKLNPGENTIDEVEAWWLAIARRFAGRFPTLAFNLLIETTDLVRQDDAVLNDLFSQCVEAVTVIDPDRVCIICPNCISAPEKLHDLIVPEGNVFVESHFYAAGPSTTNPKKQWTNGNQYERQLIYNKLNLMADWRLHTGVPVWIGAIMAGDFNSDDGNDLTCSYTPQGQADFARFVMTSARAKGLPIAWNSDTKFYDRDLNEWREEQSIVLDAIFEF